MESVLQSHKHMKLPYTEAGYLSNSVLSMLIGSRSPGLLEIIVDTSRLNLIWFWKHD